ncbi:unnamed protein product [Clonostachys chloroleuca]|uniref:Inositol-pentakisphosphate 2-kinase n=1 Tax=Clonostachys chloroleuca TaxID=1926264 RepID=A0AA35Q1Z0_9HYPO|nr:unnamed protein product [Clonostachys chloroleuca]
MVLWRKKPFVSPTAVITPSSPKIDLRPASPRAARGYASSPSCSIYSVCGDEAWISQEDMDHLRQLSEVHHPAPQNGDPYGKGVRLLPPGCKVGRLVGEGAANAVFELVLPDGSYLYHQTSRSLTYLSLADMRCAGLLLRVAKAPIDGDRPRFNYLQQYQYYCTHIKPILGSYILHQELVILRDANLIDPINDYLRAIDHQRDLKFRGTFIEPSEWGFLVEDMQPHGNNCDPSHPFEFSYPDLSLTISDPETTILVEFKPKWLSQSPNAPKNAIRCRQCAKELYSYIVDPQVGKPVPTKAKPCPLMIRNDASNPAFTDSVCRRVPSTDKRRKRLNSTLDVLRSEPAFKTLRLAQEANDHVGPLKADKKDAQFALAMTLRDCTCFAQVLTAPTQQQDSFKPLKIRFGDFDMKMPEFKLTYWRTIEEQLIKGGFYTADMIYCRGQFYRPPTKCYLERGRPTKPMEELEIIHLQEPHQKNEVDSLPPMMKSMTHSIHTDVDLMEKCLEHYKVRKPEGSQKD